MRRVLLALAFLACAAPAAAQVNESSPQKVNCVSGCSSQTQQRTYYATAEPASISYTSGTAKTLTCMWHPNTVTTTYQLERVRYGVSTTTAAQYMVTVRRITADGTGTSFAANVLPANPGDAAVNAGVVFKHTYTAEPTYATGSYTANAFSVSTANGNQIGELHLYDNDFGDAKPLTLRASQAEGWCVQITMTGTSPAAIQRVTWVFTEQ